MDNQTKELLKEARDMLVMASLLDKGQCMDVVEKIDKSLSSPAHTEVTDTRVWVERSVEKDGLPEHDAAPFENFSVKVLGVSKKGQFLKCHQQIKDYEQVIRDFQSVATTPHTGEPQYKGWNFIEQKWEDVTKDVYDTLLDPARCIIPAGEGRSKEGVENAEFVNKHLLKVMDMFADSFIKTHIERMYGGLEMASVEYFLKTGTVNGSLHMNIKNMMIKFAKNWHATAYQSNPLRDDGWVSVEDRLPEIQDDSTAWAELKDYLVANDNGVKEHSFKFYQGGFWRIKDGDSFAVRLHPVTHWMPLPSPPTK